MRCRQGELAQSAMKPYAKAVIAIGLGTAENAAATVFAAPADTVNGERDSEA